MGPPDQQTKRKRGPRVSVRRARAQYYINVPGLSKERIRRIAYSIAFFLAYDGRAINIAEGVGFKFMAKEMVKNKFYKSPSGTTLMRIIKKIIVKGKDIVTKKLDGKDCAVTSDMATVLASTKGYIVLTLHFLEVGLRHIPGITLAARHMECRHRHDLIADEVKDILQEFGVKTGQICSVTTDGGTNIIKAFKEKVLLDPDMHNHCMCHTINLIVRHAVDDCESQEEKNLTALQKVKKLIKHFKLSSGSMADFRVNQKEKGASESQVRNLKTDCRTRWNSEYLSTEVFIQLEAFVRLAVEEEHYTGPPMPDEEEMAQLDDVLLLLRSFYSATMILNGDKYVTGSLVVPCIGMIRAELQRAKNFLFTTAGVSLHKLLTQYSEEYFRVPESNINFVTACLLDPRFKDMLSVTQNAIAVDNVNQKLRNLHPPEPCAEADWSKGTIFEGHGDHFKASEDPPSASTYSRELKYYLALPVVNQNPLQFWEENEELFPKLSRIAKKSMLIAASSTASERAVSQLNIISDQKRCRLLGQHVNDLVFLRCLDLSIWEDIMITSFLEDNEK